MSALSCWCPIVIIILTVFLAAEGKYRFNINNCSPDASNATVTLSNFTLSPDPVELPGNLTVSGVVQFNTDITGNISLQLAIGRSLGFFDLPLPCINYLGSCKYEDVCSLLDQGNATLGCAKELEENGFPCKCPFMNGTYYVDHTVFVLPKLKGLLASFAQGDYTVKITLVDEDADEILGCEEIKFTLGPPAVTKTTEKPCDWLCLIG